MGIVSVKKRKRLVTSIGIDNFSSNVLDEKRPVLLAHIGRDHEFMKQEVILNDISNKYGKTLKVCLLEEDSNSIFKRYGIEGCPAFVIFHDGLEKGRILGKVDNEILNSFVVKVLPELKVMSNP